MHRTRVLLLFGGESAEHEVSIASARNVYAALDDRKYDIFLCYITKDGHWRLVDDIETLDGKHHTLMPVLGGKHFVIETGGHSIVPDVILPILHGPNGEDGSVQGLAQLLHIPIVGPGLLGSGLCMDKEVAKRLLRAAGLPVVDWLVHHRHLPAPSFAKVTLQLGHPVFVKPANMGSSVGVSRVHNEAEFTQALAEAGKYDSKILIEQAVTSPREIECSVLGNAQPEASGVGEVKPEGDFYSYDSKYSPESKSEVIIPAELDETITEQLRTLAVKAFQTLECRGMARVDFLLSSNNDVYVNELNTLPGFTNISMYPKLWRAAGLSYSGLIDKLIELALED
jgi:D-alanine-D-alanine ligase